MLQLLHPLQTKKPVVTLQVDISPSDSPDSQLNAYLFSPSYQTAQIERCFRQQQQAEHQALRQPQPESPKTFPQCIKKQPKLPKSYSWSFAF
jgi:hypothetical protein